MPKAHALQAGLCVRVTEGAGCPQAVRSSWQAHCDMPLPSEIAAMVDARTEQDEDAPTTPVPSCCLLSAAGLCRITSLPDTEVHRAVLQSVAGKWVL